MKKVLIALLVIVVLFVVVGFILPAKVHLERATTVTAPVDKVFTQVNVLKNWESWSPWHKLDPKMKLEYMGPTAGKGAMYKWTSDHKNVGNGKLTITEVKENEKIVTAMEFGGQGTAYATFTFAKVDGGTKVVWGMDSDAGKNIIARYFGLFMDKMVGPDFEKGLANLQDTVGAAPMMEKKK